MQDLGRNQVHVIPTYIYQVEYLGVLVDTQHVVVTKACSAGTLAESGKS